MLRQDGAASCHPDFEEELIALLSIYDSELQVERKASGGVSLHMKMSPAPPAYIKASVTLHIPAAGPNPQIPTAQCDTFSGSRELTAQLQQRIDSTVARQIGSGEPVCFQAFVDAQEWLDENNRPHGDCFVCICDMSDGDGVLLLPCCSQCIHSECLLQCLVSARLSQLQTPSSSAEATRDLCPACKQPTVLPPAIAAAVDSAAAAAAKDAAAAERAEMAARAYRDAKEREIAKTQRRKALLDKFTSAPNCSVCVLAHPTQTTKYFMHAFGTTFLPSHHDVAPHLAAAKFCPLECAHAYKNDSHLGYVLLTFPDTVSAEKAARSYHDSHIATFEDFNRESVYYPHRRESLGQEMSDKPWCDSK